MGTERLKGSHSMSGYHSFRAMLPRAGLHQPADHRAAAGTVLQADAGRLQGQSPAGRAGHPAAGQGAAGEGLDRRRTVRRLRRRAHDGQPAAHRPARAGEGAAATDEEAP